MNIAIVEDDSIQRKLLSDWISEAGHTCHGFDSFGSYSSHNGSHDLVLLDWGLPDSSGLDVLKWIRSNQGQQLPVMFLTCRAREDDIVTALRSGADDYLVKPARHHELLARIDALTRRFQPLVPSEALQCIDPFELNLHSRSIRRNGEPISLTHKEFDLAHFLLGNIGQLITRQELLENVWHQSKSINTRTVDTHISRLRKKLELLPENGWNLAAVYQYGYRLDRVKS